MFRSKRTVPMILLYVMTMLTELFYVLAVAFSKSGYNGWHKGSLRQQIDGEGSKIMENMRT